MQQISMLIRTRQNTCLHTGGAKSEQGKKGKYNIANKTKQITFNRKNIEVFLTHGTSLFFFYLFPVLLLCACVTQHSDAFDFLRSCIDLVP